jgi:hypothetical protein
MSDRSLMRIIGIIVALIALFVVVGILMKIIHFIFALLLPLAIIIIAVYIVYRVFVNRR